MMMKAISCLMMTGGYLVINVSTLIVFVLNIV